MCPRSSDDSGTCTFGCGLLTKSSPALAVDVIVGAAPIEADALCPLDSDKKDEASAQTEH
jgi:hypothetical protein